MSLSTLDMFKSPAIQSRILPQHPQNTAKVHSLHVIRNLLDVFSLLVVAVICGVQHRQYQDCIPPGTKHSPCTSPEQPFQRKIIFRGLWTVVEKLIFTQLVKKLFLFLEPNASFLSVF
jgi:hypothetical protein